MLSRWMKAMITIAVTSLLCAHAEQMLIRHTTAQGGTQSRGQTTTDFVTHFCSNTAVPLALRACGADAFTGGNPSPRDAATPINVILQCRDGTETLLCSTAGNRIDQMCCEGVLPQGFAAAQCTPVVRVLNGGGSVATLVTAQIDVWEATSEDLNRLQHFNVRFTPPTLPRPPPDQVRPFLTSVASLFPITVPFNRYHTQLTDIYFHYCGANSIVTFGVGGTSLAAETEVFVCEKGMDDCGHQMNHGTDGFVTVFHSIVSKTLEYGKEYFLRVYSYGHQDGNANITVAVANTVVQLPGKVTEGFSQ